MDEPLSHIQSRVTEFRESRILERKCMTQASHLLAEEAVHGVSERSPKNAEIPMQKQP